MSYVLAIGSMLAVAGAIWYFFMVPLGRERHERKLELVRRKLERLEARRRASERNEDETATS
jgi:hypothetical protein